MIDDLEQLITQAAYELQATATIRDVDDPMEPRLVVIQRRTGGPKGEVQVSAKADYKAIVTLLRAALPTEQQDD